MTKAVCVLDDDSHIAAMISRMVVASGFTARHFTAPSLFLNELNTTKPDLVILDLALGQLDAIDIIRRLENIAYKGRVLLISGRAREILSEVEQIGARHGLSMLPSLKKPFHVHQLHSALKALDRPLAEAKQGTAHGLEAPIKVDFKEAFHNGWLEVWYQPKIDLKSLLVCGAEALARVRHPERGIILPMDFLPLPGDPLHRMLAGFVLKRAMTDWTGFAASNLTLKLAVNMPVSIIRAADFVHLLRTLLPRNSRFPGLIIEITEDEVIRDPEAVREVATQLRLNNISLSIDDFGSGYATLSRLTDVPFSELKLEGRFVRGCSSHKLQRSLCQTVVDLGHGFGATVCAEGVEETADLRALVEMGCDVAQGFLFAKPMPADQFVRFLTSPPGRSSNEPSPAGTTSHALPSLDELKSSVAVTR
jgi:EAL domain-containing protein (putative c-di-GMP-specific phosphodiesterase class I)/ActR/RegA family two-component response regulator